MHVTYNNERVSTTVAMSLIGSIIERNPKSSLSTPPKPPNSTGQSGFPIAQHRSKSAFSRGREDFKKTRAQAPPPVVSANAGAQSVEREDRLRQISEENERRVADMTEEERMQERAEILKRFGPDVGDILRRAREARERRTQAVDASLLNTLQSPDDSKSIQGLGENEEKAPELEEGTL
jgi:hypothetical protein